ncbi:MAG TPA: gliding motility-associated ABC transporter substrate-binding protein GldG [Cytophagaceae bacterium]|jgi:ABC-2 type transport system permease protein|nr:gliding motility-associated ABC transporter substrate-binding protein GldG [Cytophagaceae bacterium]
MVNFNFPRRKKSLDLLEFSLILGIMVLLNALVAVYFFRLDFTEDKRYSVSPQAKEMLSKLDDPITVEIYLTGKLDPDYERLRRAIEDKLEQFKVYSGSELSYRFIDPSAETDENIRERQMSLLMQKGVQPMVYQKEEGGKKEQVRIFPGAIVIYKEREVPVQFIKGVRFSDPATYVNQAVESVEFELLQALRKLSSEDFVDIAFIEGHGELGERDASSFIRTIGNYYSIHRLDLSKDTALSRFKAVVVAQPQTKFSEQEKFILDQYLMKGGSLLYLIDPLEVRQDSLKNGETFAVIRDLNLDDQLFKYGVRVNTGLVQDLQCGIIPVQTGMNGETQLLNFPYYPLFYNFSKHPIVKNLDAVYGKFSSYIDTVKTNGVNKYPLVFSSSNARTVAAPLEIDLDALRKDATPEKFHQSGLIIANLMEGQFTSLYKNRPSPVSGKTVVPDAVKPGKVLVVADGDLMINDWDPASKQPLPLGYDKYTRTQFSNSDFLLNSLDYLTGQPLIMVRGKDIVLRPLNKFKAQEERLYWQVVNLVFPALLIVSIGIALYAIRKKRYSKFGNGSN